ncbi:MAG: FprA family A-type flavoprotein [Leptotrichiaceae bacterium]|nr:FprA family A-type flavoprotein [Leptotrichiaceae bacterium]MBP7025707.1 FprA family A-type flavoprotein [Leptotrichiaceae bacterium]MBP8636464.1 FprA family A-type flavoprotein [Leptotrichiaceae bacterium]
MHCVQNVTENIYWIGGNDRRLERFENMFPIPKGVSYNSHLILDEKTMVMDTVDQAIRMQYLENIKYLLNGRDLDYLVVNHMEPDHCGNIEDLLKIYPNMKIVGNSKTFKFFEQFYNVSPSENYYEVKEGDVIDLGKHKIQFFNMPMVHWPEVMVAYEQTEKILFSADAFGTFGALNGNIFNDQVDFEGYYLSEARRYYTNIVGKYGAQVQIALKKLSGLDIKIIAPLHGPIWRANLDYLLDKYNKWSSYTPEKQGVVIVYGSMYGNTENAANCIANKLAQQGVTDIKVYDVSKTHPSYIIADAWKYSNLVIASPTYNGGLYLVMDALLHEMASLNFQNRKVSILGNYTWATGALASIKERLSKMKDIEIIGNPLDINSSVKDNQEAALDEMVQEIVKSL